MPDNKFYFFYKKEIERWMGQQRSSNIELRGIDLLISDSD
jgi:hypothetical protein